MIQPSIPPSVQRLIDLATQWLERSLATQDLATQDLADRLVRAYIDEFTKIKSLVSASDFSWHPTQCTAMSMIGVGDAMQSIAMRNALVSIGPKAALAEASQAQRAEVLAVDVEPYELLPGIYRHFKGGLYTVALVARQEGNGERVVVYQGALGVWWTRPFDEFTGKVQTAEGAVPRFARVSP